MGVRCCPASQHHHAPQSPINPELRTDRGKEGEKRTDRGSKGGRVENAGGRKEGGREGDSTGREVLQNDGGREADAHANSLCIVEAFGPPSSACMDSLVAFSSGEESSSS